MAIVTYKRADAIKNIGADLLSKEGFVDAGKGRILSQFVDALSASLEGDYSSVYSVANNIDIGTASGDYLDRWGRILGCSRTQTSIASDLTLSNASISISPAATAKDLTIGGMPLIIPKGTQIGNGTSWPLCTVDTVAISPDARSVFCRVIGTSSTITSVSTESITKANVTLSSLAGINSSIAPSYSLSASLQYDIQNKVVMSSDSEYRYILQQRANSLGLFNASTINSLLGIDGVANIFTRKYYGGIDVYIEPTDSSIATQVLDLCRTILDQSHYGSSVNVLLPRYRNYKAVVQLDLVTPDVTLSDASVIPDLLANAINAQAMGVSISVDSLITKYVLPNLSSNVQACTISSSSYNSRLLTGTSIVQNFNEKSVTLAENIQVVS